MLLVVRVLAMLIPTLIGIQVATQWVAQAYRYHPALGAPVLVVRGVRLYAFWRFPQWVWQYGNTDIHIFTWPMYVVGLGALIGVACVVLARSLQRPQAHPTTYGTARWATKDEIKRSGLV